MGLWAASSPVSGQTCSGVLLDTRRIATAKHCLGASDLALVADGSLCTPLSSEAPRVIATSRIEIGGDLAVASLDREVSGQTPTIGSPTTGKAFVLGYGDDAATGRPACGPRTYDGELAPCQDRTGWCLLEAAVKQLCGGSSGAPVYQEGDRMTLVGLVSAGPPCGTDGAVVIATFERQP